ncbi:hypothetical protein RvY_13396 [Ramazzottius varieornatus]|uniref:Translation initiation factor eIF2B subunit epsilon n=1 Tax=Ramazzottius varieornatus TaxID=947166 RepID=A0A1D1VWA0_RAMVA|nr:hypothetical protein RvY_13396 [Ramazzottius varieornatus]
MSAQAKKKTGREGKEAFKAEDVLQAVIIADSFNERFKPLTLQQPRALLPLANCPAIAYTLEFLADVGVHEILIFCRVHADKIRAYIDAHPKWGKKGRRHRSVVVQVIVSEDCYSMGDALREIDAKNLIRGDFILVQGDLVANVDLQPALAAHRGRRSTDKNSVMTVVVRHVAPRHPARCLEDQIILTVDSTNQRVLHFQKDVSHKRTRFPVNVLEERDAVEIRNDLLDCHISICSTLVPPLFSDNFDYLTRDDFVRGILINEEILGNTIHYHVLESGYTARISNLHMYDLVSRDIISRWVFPFCPDLGFPDGSAYNYKRHHVYVPRRVVLARGAELEENVLLGRDCVIGNNTKIRNSVIGDNCKIGDNCVIDGSYLWDNCEIGSKVRIESGVLASGCRVGDESQLERGCVLSYNVHIGSGQQLRGGVRLIGEEDNQILVEKPEDQDMDTETGLDNFETLPEDYGSDQKLWSFQLKPDGDNDEDESEKTGPDFNQVSWNWWIPPALELAYSPEEESDSDEEECEDFTDAPALGVHHAVGNAWQFYLEIFDSLMGVTNEDVNPENAVLEINSSKHAYGISMSDVNKLVLRAVLEIPELRGKTSKKEFSSSNEVHNEVTNIVKKVLPVFRNYYRNAESQLDALFSLEDCLVNYIDMTKHQPYGAHLADSAMKLFHFLYEQDILGEEVILKWYRQASNKHVEQFLPFFLHESSSPTSPSRRRHQSGDLTDEDVQSLIKKIDALKKKVEKFVVWLMEAEEEDDSDQNEE